MLMMRTTGPATTSVVGADMATPEDVLTRYAIPTYIGDGVYVHFDGYHF